MPFIVTNAFMLIGNFDGDNKLQSETNESVIMGDLDLNHNGKKGLGLENKYPNTTCQPTNGTNVVHFQTPYAMTNIADNDERLQLNQMCGSPLKSVGAIRICVEHPH